MEKLFEIYKQIKPKPTKDERDNLNSLIYMKEI